MYTNSLFDSALSFLFSLLKQCRRFLRRWSPTFSPVLRFRCSSKPFCSVIDSPDFTKRHLNHSAQTNSNQSLVFELKSIRGRTEVIGSCNGLLCLCYSEDEVVVLWNMSTGKHFRCPHLPIISPILDPPSYGFGYDSVRDDYKLVRILKFHTLETQVMIYRLKSNSWEMVAAFPYDLPYQSRAVFADGALYWVIRLPGSGYFSTAAFDLATEEYREVPQPPGAPNWIFLSPWESSLCAIRIHAGIRIDICVLQPNGCWDQFLSFSDPLVTMYSYCIVPMAYLSNGNEVLLLHNYKNLFRYDLKTTIANDVWIQGMPTSFNAVIYVESLVKPFPMADGASATTGKDKSPRSRNNVSKRDDFLSKGFRLVL